MTSSARPPSIDFALWSLDRAIGPLHEERRLLAREPERYRRHQSAVPYWHPRRPRADGDARCA